MPQISLKLLLSLTLILIGIVVGFLFFVQSHDRAMINHIEAKVLNPIAQKVLYSHVEAESIFKSRCQPCHGKYAQNQALSKSEPINTWSAEAIEKALHTYKEGKRNRSGMGMVMGGQTSQLTDSQIKGLALYISKL